MWTIFAESTLSYGSFLFAMQRTTQSWKNKYSALYNQSLKRSLGVAKDDVGDKTVSRTKSPEMGLTGRSQVH